MKKSKNHDIVVKNAYSWLVVLRRRLEDAGDWESAKAVSEAYKQLWCECLNEPAPWK